MFDIFKTPGAGGSGPDHGCYGIVNVQFKPTNPSHGNQVIVSTISQTQWQSICAILSKPQ